MKVSDFRVKVRNEALVAAHTSQKGWQLHHICGFLHLLNCSNFAFDGGLLPWPTTWRRYCKVRNPSSHLEGLRWSPYLCRSRMMAVRAFMWVFQSEAWMRMLSTQHETCSMPCIAIHISLLKHPGAFTKPKGITLNSCRVLVD